MGQFLSKIMRIPEFTSQLRESKVFSSSVQFYAVYPELGVKERKGLRYSFEQIQKVVKNELCMELTDQQIKQLLAELDRGDRGIIVPNDFIRCLEYCNTWKYIKKFKNSH